MKKDTTEIIFILDRSGSMKSSEADTIGGYNSFLDKQREQKGKAYVTTVLFDNYYEVLHDHVNLKKVVPITEKDYFARGMTALLDAIGRTISDAKRRHHAGKTICVIITDGYENASKEYRLHTVKEMIKKQTEEHGWEFIFLGANIDAIETASQIGIAPAMTANFHSDGIGTRANFEGISQAVTSFRACGNVPSSWRAPIDLDFRKRTKRS